MARRDSLADVITKRYDFVAALLEEPRSKPGLVETLDISRSTVDRAVAELEEKGLVTREDGGYRATFTGKCVQSVHRDYRQQLADIERANDVLEALPCDVDIDPSVIVDATIEAETRYGADYAFRRTIDLIHDASRFRAVGAAVPPQHLEDVHECVLNNGLEIELVVTPEVVEVFRRVECEAFRELARRDGVSLYRIEDGTRFALWTVDTRSGAHSGLAVYTDSGVEGVITNDTPAMNEWARDSFASYRERASELKSLPDLD